MREKVLALGLSVLFGSITPSLARADQPKGHAPNSAAMKMDRMHQLWQFQDKQRQERWAFEGEMTAGQRRFQDGIRKMRHDEELAVTHLERQAQSTEMQNAHDFKAANALRQKANQERQAREKAIRDKTAAFNKEMNEKSKSFRDTIQKELKAFQASQKK